MIYEMLHTMIIPAWVAGACAGCWVVTVLVLLKARRDSALHLRMFRDADKRFELERDKRWHADALATELAMHIECMKSRSDAGRVMPGVQAEQGPDRVDCIVLNLGDHWDGMGDDIEELCSMKAR